MGGSDNKGDGLASQPCCYRVPGQPLLNRHQVGGVRSPDGLFAQQKREPIRGRPAVSGKRTYGGRTGQRAEEQGTWASQKHSEAGYGRPEDRGVWTAKTVKRPRQQPAHPQYATYWAPLICKRHTMPHSAQPQHTKYWAPRTRKRHQQEHRLQQPTESSDPTQHAKGRTGDRPGPRKGATTRRNVTQGAACCCALDRGSRRAPGGRATLAGPVATVAAAAVDVGHNAAGGSHSCATDLPHGGRLLLRVARTGPTCCPPPPPPPRPLFSPAPDREIQGNDGRTPPTPGPPQSTDRPVTAVAQGPPEQETPAEWSQHRSSVVNVPGSNPGSRLLVPSRALFRCRTAPLSITVQHRCKQSPDERSECRLLLLHIGHASGGHSGRPRPSRGVRHGSQAVDTTADSTIPS